MSVFAGVDLSLPPRFSPSKTFEPLRTQRTSAENAETTTLLSAEPF